MIDLNHHIAPQLDIDPSHGHVFLGLLDGNQPAISGAMPENGYRKFRYRKYSPGILLLNRIKFSVGTSISGMDIAEREQPPPHPQPRDVPPYGDRRVVDPSDTRSCACCGYACIGISPTCPQPAGAPLLDTPPSTIPRAEQPTAASLAEAFRQ